MNVTNHCKQRYVERIKGITNTLECKEYVVQNQEKIENDINTLFSYATFLVSMQLNGDLTSKNFYIKDDIIFVVDTSDTTIITLYRIDFGFPTKTNKVIIKDLMEEIEGLKSLINEYKSGTELYISRKQTEIEQLQSKINIAEEQISNYKQKINLANEEIATKKKDGNVAKLELKDYVNKLCNSLDYKNDLKKISNK